MIKKIKYTSFLILKFKFLINSFYLFIRILNHNHTVVKIRVIIMCMKSKIYYGPDRFAKIISLLVINASKLEQNSNILNINPI